MPGKIVLSLLFVSLFHCGHGTRFEGEDPKAICRRKLHLNDSWLADPHPRSEHSQWILESGDGRGGPLLPARPLFGAPISQEDRGAWIVRCNNEQPGYECSKAVDGSRRTFWHAKIDMTGQQLNPWPLTIDIDLRAVKNVNAISMKPRFYVESEGMVAGHRVYLSLDGSDWGEPVAYGTWSDDETDKYAIFEPHPAQYVRFEATSAVKGDPFISVEDFSVWASDSFVPAAPGLGKWGDTINFPNVPVAVFMTPADDTSKNKIITFSSYLKNDFNQGEGKLEGKTWTSTWDRAASGVSGEEIALGHDMFCPGTAYDVNGRMFVTGGVSDQKTSIYDPATSKWTAAEDMNIGRGYQGSTTFSDGRIFVIGGSWAPEGEDKQGGKKGEMYDFKSKTWQLIDDLPAEPLSTTEDWQPSYRGDNHIWLFGWKDNSIFHAGPAKNMHWITVTGTKGAIKGAGPRAEPGKLVDRDAMCGVAAMYDAVQGKILAAGGAPQYKYCDDRTEGTGNTYHPASNNAFVITLGKTNQTVSVKQAGDKMKFKRVFHHAVILPNGDTFVVGGQGLGQGFTDQTPVLTPEIYSPQRGSTKDSWTSVATHTIPRTYHSFGLLLPDATVLVGGGGLCGPCGLVNHFDAQVYIPQYLLTSSGTPASRPSITSVSPTAGSPGATLTIITKGAVVAASLVRYGSATHSLNNDQRRIELQLQPTDKAFQYKVSIPPEQGVAIPGWWMLFVIDAAGVPSEAKNVKIQVAP